MTPSYTLECRKPFLIVTFDQPHRVLSWSITHPGTQTANRVVWLEVRNADLPKDIDPLTFTTDKLRSHGLENAVALITSADIREHYKAHISLADISASCVTTVGLTNGERVGSRFSQGDRHIGTINTLVHTSCPLSEAAVLETLSIATEARTTAVLDKGPKRNGVAITGTGTDCIAIAAPISSPDAGREAVFAGLHTALGEAVGAAVYQATSEGVDAWMQAQTQTK